MTAPTWRHDCGHQAVGLIPRPCPGCGQHGSWIAGGTQVVAQTAPPARLAFVAGDPRPPTRMAWHDPAPSLAEKARADVTYTAAEWAQPHRYLSTGCLHGEHDYCSATSTEGGAAKQPARCKFCPSPCVCPCHAGEAHDGR